MIPGLHVGLVIPDLWQQEAIRALQQRKDVVVQAPTGSGKTYIFELFYPNLKEQAVFTVPTRALPNNHQSELSVARATAFHDFDLVRSPSGRLFLRPTKCLLRL